MKPQAIGIEYKDMVTSFQRPLRIVKAPGDSNENFIEFRQLQDEEKVRLSAGQAVSQSSIKTAVPVRHHALNVHESAVEKLVTQASSSDDLASTTASNEPGYWRRNSTAFSVFAAIVVGVLLGIIGITWQSSGISEVESVASNTRSSQPSFSKQASAEERPQESADASHPALPPESVPESPPESVPANMDANVDAKVEVEVDEAAAAAAAAAADQIENELNSTQKLALQYKQELKRLNARNASLHSEVDARGKEASELNNELSQLELDLAAKKQAGQPKVETRTVYNFVNGAVGSNPGFNSNNNNNSLEPYDSSAPNVEIGGEIVDDELEQIPVEWDSNGQPIVFVDAFSEE